LKKFIIIAAIALLQSCASDIKPLAVIEVQGQNNNAFTGIKVVYKSMMRAMQNKFGGDSLNLDILEQIDRIYYYQKDSASFGFTPNLGSRLDSIIAIDNYTELSKISRYGKSYGIYVKNQESRVSEILILQQSAADIMLIDIQGNISMKDVMKNLTNLPDLLQLSDIDFL